jgi:hypothetical protein
MRLTQYAELEAIHQTETFTLREGVVLKLRALSPDYDDLLQEELPSPTPKRLGFEKERGKVLTDANGKPVARYEDEDPAFLRASRENAKLGLVKMVLDGIEPGQLEVDATKDPNDPAAFYRVALKEMTAFGFNLGDIINLAKRIQELSGITDEEVKVAEEDFFGAED